jgi:hypothetical protein
MTQDKQSRGKTIVPVKPSPSLSDQESSTLSPLAEGTNKKTRAPKNLGSSFSLAEIFDSIKLIPPQAINKTQQVERPSINLAESQEKDPQKDQPKLKILDAIWRARQTETKDSNNSSAPTKGVTNLLAKTKEPKPKSTPISVGSRPSPKGQTKPDQKNRRPLVVALTEALTETLTETLSGNSWSSDSQKESSLLDTSGVREKTLTTIVAKNHKTDKNQKTNQTTTSDMVQKNANDLSDAYEALNHEVLSEKALTKTVLTDEPQTSSATAFKKIAMDSNPTNSSAEVTSALSTIYDDIVMAELDIFGSLGSDSNSLDQVNSSSATISSPEVDNPLDNHLDNHLDDHIDDPVDDPTDEDLDLIACPISADSTLTSPLADNKSSSVRLAEDTILSIEGDSFLRNPLTTEQSHIEEPTDFNPWAFNSYLDPLKDSSDLDRLKEFSDFDSFEKSSDLLPLKESSDLDRLTKSSDFDRLNGPSDLDRLTKSSNFDRLNGPSNFDRLNGPSDLDLRKGPSDQLLLKEPLDHFLASNLESFGLNKKVIREDLALNESLPSNQESDKSLYQTINLELNHERTIHDFSRRPALSGLIKPKIDRPNLTTSQNDDEHRLYPFSQDSSPGYYPRPRAMGVDLLHSSLDPLVPSPRPGSTGAGLPPLRDFNANESIPLTGSDQLNGQDDRSKRQVDQLVNQLDQLIERADLSTGQTGPSRGQFNQSTNQDKDLNESEEQIFTQVDQINNKISLSSQKVDRPLSQADQSDQAEDPLITLSLRWFLRQTQKFRLVALTLAIGIVLLALTSAYLVISKPEPRYFWISDDMRVMEAIAINDSRVMSANLINWTSRVLKDSLSLDYLHYQESLESQKANFTPEAFVEFVESLKAEGHLKKIENEKLVLTCELNGSPVVVETKDQSDRLIWRLEAPLVVLFQSSAGVALTQKLLAMVEIQKMKANKNPFDLKIKRLALLKNS